MPSRLPGLRFPVAQASACVGLVLARTDPAGGSLRYQSELLYDGSLMFHRKRFRLQLPSRTLILGERTLVMGVLNVTPDSFSDGGEFLEPRRAVEHALDMEEA